MYLYARNIHIGLQFMHTFVREHLVGHAEVTTGGQPYLLKDICSACLHKPYPGAGG